MLVQFWDSRCHLELYHHGNNYDLPIINNYGLVTLCPTYLSFTLWFHDLIV